MEDIAQERALLDAEWEKLRLAKEEFQTEMGGSVLEQKLFVGNLDDATGEEEVRALFEPHGEIKEIYMLRDKDGKSKRSGFVKMFTKASAERAIEEISGKIKDKGQEKMIVVRFAAPKTFPGGPGGGGGAPHPFAQQQQFGGMPPYGQPAAYGYQAPAAPYGGYGADQGYGQGGYTTRSTGMGGGGMPGAMGGGGGGMGAGRGPTGSNLYINNVAPTASEDEVRAMFSDFGTVLSIKLFAAQGYGFVSYDNMQSASNAIHALNGLAIGNGQKRLEVSIKKDKGPARFSPY